MYKMKNVATKLILTISFFTLLVITHNGCKKSTTDAPANPFATIKYGTLPTDTVPDPYSLVGIHTNILKPKCSVPGCHDGNFEPDFRTPQSSFATLVYHPIKKNNADSTFSCRVIPYKPSESVLYERITNCCFVNQDDRMPQDNIGVPLPTADVDAIKKWITDGAKDMFGKVAIYPNLEPTISPYCGAVDAATYKISYAAPNNRIDSVGYNTFYLPQNTNVIFVFVVSDDSTAFNQLQVNQMRMSLDPDDFSNATSLTATYYHIPPPNANDFFGITVNTSTLPQNQVVYMRYFVNDGDHVNNTHFPTDNLIMPYKTLWSFMVK
jgi:hypothetical protein